MDNEKLLDDILKEKARSEKTSAPPDITEHMLNVISSLPEKNHRNIFALIQRKLRNYKVSTIIRGTAEVAVVILILIMIPILTVHYSKKGEVKNQGAGSIAGDNAIKAAILDTLSSKNIQSVQQAPGGFAHDMRIETFLPDRDSERIKAVKSLIESSAGIRKAEDNELAALGMKGGGPQYIKINMKDGKSFEIVPAMWIKMTDDGGGQFLWYDDRFILMDNEDKQNFYTCFSKEGVKYLRSITIGNKTADTEKYEPVEEAHVNSYPYTLSKSMEIIKPIEPKKFDGSNEGVQEFVSVILKDPNYKYIPDEIRKEYSDTVPGTPLFVKDEEDPNFHVMTDHYIVPLLRDNVVVGIFPVSIWGDELEAGSPGFYFDAGEGIFKRDMNKIFDKVRARAGTELKSYQLVLKPDNKNRTGMYTYNPQLKITTVDGQVFYYSTTGLILTKAEADENYKYKTLSGGS